MSSTDDFLELFLKDNPLMSTEFGILSSEPVNSLQTSIPQSTPNLNITNMEKIGTTPPISVEQTQVPTDIENTHQKRTQVPKACSNCRRMHAGCDLGRPCKRCIQNGLESSCIDVPRKKRASRKKTNDAEPKVQEVWDPAYAEVWGTNQSFTPQTPFTIEYFQPEGLLRPDGAASAHALPSSSSPTQMSVPPVMHNSTATSQEWSFLIQQISELRESNKALESKLLGVSSELADMKGKHHQNHQMPHQQPHPHPMLQIPPAPTNNIHSLPQNAYNPSPSSSSAPSSSSSNMLTGWYTFTTQPELAISVWRACSDEGGCTRNVLVECNQKFVEMLGYPVEVLKSNFTCSKLVRKQDICPEYREKTGRDWPRKTQIITAFGLKDVWLTISPVHNHNSAIKYYIVHIFEGNN